MSVVVRNPQLKLFATVMLVASAFVTWYFTTGSEPPAPKGERPPEPAPRHLPHPSEVRVARDNDAAPARVDATPDATEPAAVDPGAAPFGQRVVLDEVERIIWKRLVDDGNQVDNPWQLEGSGTLRASHPDGTPMVEGRFVGGQPDGLWTRWHPDGRLMSTVAYQRGVPLGELVK